MGADAVAVGTFARTPTGIAADVVARMTAGVITEAVALVATEAIAGTAAEVIRRAAAARRLALPLKRISSESSGESSRFFLTGASSRFSDLVVEFSPRRPRTIVARGVSGWSILSQY